MKKTILLLFAMISILASTPLYAEQKVPLGIDHVSVKLDYMRYTDFKLPNHNLKIGPYIGLEAYKKIKPTLYAGLGIGYTKLSDDAGGYLNLDFTGVPVELNAKCVFPVARNITLDGGLGLCYFFWYAEINDSFGTSDSGGVFGGQFFMDLNYNMGPYFFGLNMKYQFTNEEKIFSGTDLESTVKFNSWRLGGQLGVKF